MATRGVSHSEDDWQDIDLGQVRAPGRTLLPHLKPIGGGTGQVEGMASYITRLALATTSSPIDLLRHFIGWFATGVRKKLGAACPEAGTICYRNAVLLGAVGPKLASALEHLTGVGGLQALHMAGLLKVFSSFELARRQRAWCPQCLHEDRTPYDRLLWSVECVTHCPKHAIPLSTTCPSCHRSQPHLSHNGAAHRCHACGMRLDQVPCQVAEQADAFAVWSARTVEDFIGWTQSANVELTVEPLLQGLRLGFESPYIMSPRKLAKLLGAASTTVYGWTRGRMAIRLGMVVRIAWLYNLELRDLVEARVQAGRIRPITECPWVNSRVRRSRSRRVSPDEIVNTTRRLRSMSVLRCPPQEAVAADLGISQWHPIFDDERVRDFFEQSRRRIARMRSTLHVWETCNAIRGAVATLLEEGRPITHRNVCDKLSRWGVKAGVMRALFARRLLSLVVEGIDHERPEILRPRPPPKIIQPIVELVR